MKEEGCTMCSRCGGRLDPRGHCAVDCDDGIWWKQ